MKAERSSITIGAFDLMKGTGIIGIVAGHTLSDYDGVEMASVFLRLLGAGLMPAFFIISGFGLKKKETAKFLKKTSKELLKPYAAVTVTIAILFPIIHFLTFHWWPGTLGEAKKFVLAFLTGSPRSGKVFGGTELYEASVVWYLLTLFGAMNLLNVLLNKTGEKIQVLAACISVLSGFVLLRNDVWYYCMPQIFLAVGYVYFGYWAKQKKWFDRKLPVWQMIVLLIFSVFEIIWGDCSFSYGIFRWGILDYIASGCLGILLIRVTLLMNRYNGAVLECIRRFGRYTYFAMCVHSVEMSCIPWYLFAGLFQEHPYAGFFLQVFLRGALIISGCMFLRYFVRNQYKRGAGKCIIQRS